LIKRTILCHFYNEEYLLPWWLKHHRQMFDHGIMINYASTDSSCDLIRELCPTWEIVDSRNPDFGPIEAIDSEVVDLERSVSGPRICLNVTEFLYGNYSLLDQLKDNEELIIPTIIPVDDQWDRYYSYDRELLDYINVGVHYKDEIPYGGSPSFRQCRCARAIAAGYPLGRHFPHHNTTELAVFWHGLSPMNLNMLKRKYQIGDRRNQSDKDRGFGHQHNWDRSAWDSFWDGYKRRSTDLSAEINRLRAAHKDAIASRN
jgi:hypothetical protein